MRSRPAERGLATRCAWCERYLVKGRWVSADAVAELGVEKVTHGICPDCLDRLKAAGLSE
jgi:hypothetical protein